LINFQLLNLYRGYRIMVIILPCQGRDTGSIPVTRSMRTIWRKAKPQDTEKKFWVNQQIRVPEVFLIDENDERVGPTPTFEALKRAEEAGLDLVQVDPKGVPPVAKIMDYGQFKYEKEKQAHKQKVQQKKVEIKCVRISVRISEHDFNFRIDQAKKFLEKGNKLKLELNLKGRERQHPEKAGETIKNFVVELKKSPDLSLIEEQPLTRQGGRFNIILVNKKS
jgi:translation initiation factor IF-3